MNVDVLLRQLDPDLPVPGYAHVGDAGADLHARIDLTLDPHTRRAVPTGIAIALPEGFAALVVPRSGLARRHGLSMVNTPGLIDAGYRGEISVLLINHDPIQAVSLSRGDRIAQLVVLPVAHARFQVVSALPGSDRGEGGFGSSGHSQALS